MYRSDKISLLRMTAALILLFCLAGCIENDIPYPRKVGKITSIAFSGQLQEPIIDDENFLVTVELSDTVNLERVRLLRFETGDSVRVAPEITSFVDLRTPLKYFLSTYPDQTYEWSIKADQEIERYIRVENQVQDALIDGNECSVLVYVSEDQPLDKIEILEAKLGPSDAVTDPDPRSLHDFREVQKVIVRYRDAEETWRIKVVQKAASAQTNFPDAWACQAVLKGFYSPSYKTDPSFEYKKAADESWTAVDRSAVVIKGSNVTALVKGLEPSTEYVCRLAAGERKFNEESFRTEAAAQMPNMSFDGWLKKGKSWYPDPDMEENYWWDTGNPGANTIGESNPTSPEENHVALKGEGKKAVRMETVKVAGLIMAGGNIFSGRYLKTSGLGAQVEFGRPFTSRPLQLKGYYSYTPQIIDCVKPPYAHLEGKMDRCRIFVYVTDWEKPYLVDTNKKIYLDENDPHVIGFASFTDSVGTGGNYKEFTLDIEYRNSRKPTYCAVVAVASYYADYFVGGIGSVLYVDEFNFVYEGDVKWKKD